MGTVTSRVGHSDESTSPSSSLLSEERQLASSSSSASTSSSWPCANCHATCSGTGPCPACHGMQAPVHIMQLSPSDFRLANAIIMGTSDEEKMADSNEPTADSTQESARNKNETGIMEQTSSMIQTTDASSSRQLNSKADRIAQQQQQQQQQQRRPIHDDFRPVDPVGLTLAAVPSPVIVMEDHKRKRDLWFSAIHRTSSPTTFVTHLTTPDAPRKKRMGVLSE